tara:strand:- start:160 stop:573 length:414 start_codon:yes stop_codon:yes gene_type:complete
LKKKISKKDKKVWLDFISNDEKLPNKDFNLNYKNKNNKIKTLDLHGFSLENANSKVEDFIINCSKRNVKKIIVITGKGLRSKNIENPYVSKDLSILKYSIPSFIKSKPDLMKIIKNISDASIEDGGEGAFYIFLKNS